MFFERVCVFSFLFTLSVTFELKTNLDSATFDLKYPNTNKDSATFEINDLNTNQDSATFDSSDSNTNQDTLTFDLNDPKTNLDSFVRVSGSQDPSVSSVNYINGTILIKLKSGTLKKAFLLEGFNIGRKVPKSFGYLSLSREFLVYRDYKTGTILDVFMNDVSHTANEVFNIHNDPVNLNLTYGPIIPYVILQQDRVGFNEDILLQYPNTLDPKTYPKFSAGPLYEADELFQFYTRYSTLANTKIQALNFTGTWVRRSQFLPWLELGDYSGHLYYISTNWKCANGLADIPADIMSIVKKKYPRFQEAPTTFEVPNQTSWSNFKAVIDKRRKEGKKDIIIPEVPLIPHPVQKKNNLDPRIYESLAQVGSFQVSFSGKVYSEITGNYSINLFNVKGVINGRVLLTPGGPELTTTAKGSFLDLKTGEELKTWLNPLTGQTNNVPTLSGSYSKVVMIHDDFVWSIPVPNSGETALIGYDSSSTFDKVSGTESWSVNLLDVFFNDDGLVSKNPYFYGTWIQFSSWLDWMDMKMTEGNLVWRMNVEKKQV